MRASLILAAVLALAAALFAATTHSAPALKPVQVKCGEGGITFLFWPKGHGTIRKADLGAHPAAHIELYKSDSYKGSNLLGFVNYKGKIRFSSKCDKGGKVPVSGGVPRNITVTKRSAISCEIGSASEIRVSSAPGGVYVDLGIPGHGEARAMLKKRGSSFLYDNQLCRVGPVPR
jgi:hypothetical protein